MIKTIYQFMLGIYFTSLKPFMLLQKSEKIKVCFVHIGHQNLRILLA